MILLLWTIKKLLYVDEYLVRLQDRRNITCVNMDVVPVHTTMKTLLFQYNCKFTEKPRYIPIYLEIMIHIKNAKHSAFIPIEWKHCYVI